MPDVVPLARPSFLRRLASMFYEALLLLAVLAVLLVLPHVLLGAFAHRLAAPGVIQAHCLLVLLVYFVYFWSNGGQTLAMKTWRIRLVTQEGSAVRPGQALVRFLWCWPSILLAGIGIVWALFDRDRLFLHDRLAGTRLVMINTPRQRAEPNGDDTGGSTEAQAGQAAASSPAVRASRERR